MKIIPVKTLLETLHSRGITDSAIAKSVGCQVSAINKTRRGKQIDLSYSIGKLLEAIERKTRNRRKTDIL